MAMSLEKMLPILQSPRSGGPLIRSGDKLVGPAGETYPIVNGKPILVRAVAEMHVTPPAARFISRNAEQFEIGDGFGEDAIVLHLGSGNIPSVDPRVISLDVLPTENVDLVAEAESLPFRTGSIDHIASGAVFEHIPDPMTSIREVRRILKPGGTFVIDTAFMQGYHGFPGHFFNMTPQAIETFLVDDFILEASLMPFSATGTAVGPTMTEHVLEQLPAGMREQLLSGTLRDGLAKIKSGELAPFMSEMAGRSIAMNYVVRARKPERYEERSREIAEKLGPEEWKRLKRSYYAARVRVIDIQGTIYKLRTEAIHDHVLPDIPEAPALSALLDRGHIADPMNSVAWIDAVKTLDGVSDGLMPLYDQLTRLCMEARDRRNRLVG